MSNTDQKFFVGRSEELSRLDELLCLAIDFRAPQHVTLIGNMGTGKTSLIEEWLGKLPPEIQVRRAHPRSEPGGTLKTLLSSWFELEDRLDQESRLGRLDEKLESFLSREERAEMRFFLARYLSMEVPRTALFQCLGENEKLLDALAFAMLKRWVEISSNDRPCVLVVDGAQEADEFSLALLRRLAAELEGAQVLMIESARTEFVRWFTDPGAGTSDQHRIELGNLDEHALRQIIEKLVPECAIIPQELVEHAQDASGGNPYFVARLIERYREGDVFDQSTEPWICMDKNALAVSLPMEVGQAISARIAGLDAYERALLEKAVVFGNVFWLGAIVAMTRLEQAGSFSDVTPPLSSDASLDYGWSRDEDATQARVEETIESLVSRDYLLCIEGDDSMIRGEREFAFKHNLERELVERSTWANKKLLYNDLAMQWLDGRPRADSGETIEFLARIYERNEKKTKAATRYLTAGRFAQREFAYAQAIDLFRRGLSLSAQDDAMATLQGLYQLGSALEKSGRLLEASQQYALMLRRAWLLGQNEQGALAHACLGRILGRGGFYDLSMAHLEKAERLFGESRDTNGKADVQRQMAEVHWRYGEYAEARALMREAMEACHASKSERGLAQCLYLLGRVEREQGTLKASSEKFSAALTQLGKMGDAIGCAWTAYELAVNSFIAGDKARTVERIGRANTLAKEINDPALVICLRTIGSQFALRDSTRGLMPEELEETHAAAAGLGDVFIELQCEFLLALGPSLKDTDVALNLAKKALKKSQRVGSPYSIGVAHRVVAQTYLRRGDLDSSSREIQRSISMFSAIENSRETAASFKIMTLICQKNGDFEGGAAAEQQAKSYSLKFLGS